MSENSTGTTNSGMGDIDMVGDEPSMEDILASIRKIISDDEGESSVTDQPSEIDMLSQDDELVAPSQFDHSLDFVHDSENEVKGQRVHNNLNNELLSQEFEADELDELLSFDDLDIPDSTTVTPSTEIDAIHTPKDVKSSLGDSVSDITDLTDVFELPEQGQALKSDSSESMSEIFEALDLTVKDKGSSSDMDVFASIASEAGLYSASNSGDDHISAYDVKNISLDAENSDTDLSLGDLEDLDFITDSTEFEPGEGVKNDTVETAQGVNSAGETDMDLVKSLMADLADDSFLSDEELLQSNIEAETSLNASMREITLPDETVSSDQPTSDVVTDDLRFGQEDFRQENFGQDGYAQEEHAHGDMNSGTLSSDDETSILDEISSMTMAENDDRSQMEKAPETGALEPSTLLKGASLSAIATGATLNALGRSEDSDAETVSDTSSVEIASGDNDTDYRSDDVSLDAASMSFQEIANRAEETARDAETVKSRTSILDQVWLQDSSDEALDMSDTSDASSLEDIEGQDVQLINEKEKRDEILESVQTVDDIDDAPSQNVKSDSKEAMEMANAMRSDAILDEVTARATSGAFAELNNVVEEKAIIAERGDRIGDLVQEALRPMLKDWLDENLKGIVERAVAKEVKRISTGK